MRLLMSLLRDSIAKVKFACAGFRRKLACPYLGVQTLVSYDICPHTLHGSWLRWAGGEQGK